ncbi:MAG: hypothetical protein RLZZ381_615 [Cyanobacteriota bacterium]|jgi:uncharacterized membrane protein
MKSLLANAFEAFNQYSGWIVWNLFLAFIPLALSFWLFTKPQTKTGSKPARRSLFWWAIFLIFIAFLPNAPYLLTDIIHLIAAIRANYSIWITTLIFIPLHLFAIFLGWESYVISVLNQSRYLEKQGAKKFVFISEILIHALCAVGIYLGRFLRFNSWDFVTKPDIVLVSTIDNLTNKKPLLVIMITFAILTILYWLSKQITLGIWWRIRNYQ